MTMDIERRFVAAADLRVVTGEGLKQKLRGHAVVFDSLSEDMFFFREMIAPEAVDRTFSERIDVRALIDHDPAKIMGRLTARTLTMQKDQRGLLVEIDPPDTTYSRDALESVRRGDLTGMSFAFRGLKDQWDEKTDPPTRTVLDMRILEVSVVTFPAYPATDVDVAARSLAAFRQERGYRPSVDLLTRKLHLLR
jgi:phage prohead protease, HK97 family